MTLAAQDERLYFIAALIATKDFISQGTFYVSQKKFCISHKRYLCYRKNFIHIIKNYILRRKFNASHKAGTALCL